MSPRQPKIACRIMSDNFMSSSSTLQATGLRAVMQNCCDLSIVDLTHIELGCRVNPAWYKDLFASYLAFCDISDVGAHIMRGNMPIYFYYRQLGL